MIKIPKILIAVCLIIFAGAIFIIDQNSRIYRPADKIFWNYHHSKIVDISNEGLKYHEKNDFDKALKLYNKALRKIGKVRKEMAAKNFTEKELIDLYKDDEGGVRYNIGDVYMHINRLEESLKELNKAAELAPHRIDIFQDKSVVYRLMGRYQDSITACEETLKMDPDFDTAYCTMGWAYEKLGNYEKAIECQKKAVELSPRYYFAYYKMGVSYEKLGDYEKAARSYENALKINNIPSLRYALVQVYIKLGKPKEEVEALMKD